MLHWSKSLSAWMLRRLPRESGLTLAQSRIYLLPTGFGWMLIVVAMAVWIGALNYAVSLAYVLAFWIVALLMVSVLMAYRQLSGLHISGVEPEGVFAGEMAAFPVQLVWPAGEVRYLRLALSDGVAVAPDSAGLACLPYRAGGRGQRLIPPVRVYSEAPLGLIRAFAYVRLLSRLDVYPNPVKDELAVALLSSTGEVEELIAQTGGEDYSHLSDWSPAMGSRRIAWSAYARSGKLMARQFDRLEPRGGMGLLAWDRYPSSMDTESRLSRLCWQLQQQARLQRSVVLRLPGQEHVLISGDVTAGLRALSRFGVHDGQ